MDRARWDAVSSLWRRTTGSPSTGSSLPWATVSPTAGGSLTLTPLGSSIGRSKLGRRCSSSNPAVQPAYGLRKDLFHGVCAPSDESKRTKNSSLSHNCCFMWTTMWLKTNSRKYRQETVMASFYNTDLGLSTSTREDLNRCALERGGVWGAIGYGYAMPGALPRARHGYTFRWIGRQGMGNSGMLVLKGTTPETRELLHQGVVKELMERFELPYSEADPLAAAVRRTQYGREQAVQEVAVQHGRNFLAWWEFDQGVGSPGRSTSGWCEKWGIPRISLWRLTAARQLVKEVWG
jgi:hypothetical protein